MPAMPVPGARQLWVPSVECVRETASRAWVQWFLQESVHVVTEAERSQDPTSAAGDPGEPVV